MSQTLYKKSRPISQEVGFFHKTNKTVVEYFPYEFSALEIWTNLESDNVKYLGTI